jgi:hypothetical protein
MGTHRRLKVGYWHHVQLEAQPITGNMNGHTYWHLGARENSRVDTTLKTRGESWDTTRFDYSRYTPVVPWIYAREEQTLTNTIAWALKSIYF